MAGDLTAEFAANPMAGQSAEINQGIDMANAPAMLEQRILANQMSTMKNAEEASNVPVTQMNNLNALAKAKAINDLVWGNTGDGSLNLGGQDIVSGMGANIGQNLASQSTSGNTQVSNAAQVMANLGNQLEQRGGKLDPMNSGDVQWAQQAKAAAAKVGVTNFNPMDPAAQSTLLSWYKGAKNSISQQQELTKVAAQGANTADVARINAEAKRVHDEASKAIAEARIKNLQDMQKQAETHSTNALANYHNAIDTADPNKITPDTIGKWVEQGAIGYRSDPQFSGIVNSIHQLQASGQVWGQEEQNLEDRARAKAEAELSRLYPTQFAAWKSGQGGTGSSSGTTAPSATTQAPATSKSLTVGGKPVQFQEKAYTSGGKTYNPGDPYTFNGKTYHYRGMSPDGRPIVN